MADAFYTNGYGELARTATCWNASGVDHRAILVSSAYTFSAAHTSLTSIAAGARIATLTAGLANKTVANNGALDCDDFTWASVAAGSTGVAYVIYRHTGSDATAVPIAYVDSPTGLPVTTDGNNITRTLPATGLLKIGPAA